MDLISDQHTVYSFTSHASNTNDNGYSSQTTANQSFQRHVARYGVNNPNWKFLIQRRQNASSPYLHWGQSVKTSGGSTARCDYFYDDLGTPRRGLLTVTGNQLAMTVGDYLGTNVTALSNSSYNDLVVRFLNKIRSVQRSFDGSTNLGEFRETLHGLMNPAKALRHGLSDYLHSVKKRTKGISKSKILPIVKDTYLEYTFGWRPLIGAISDIGKALNKHLDTVYPTERVSVMAKESLSLEGTPYLLYSTPEPWFRYSVEVKTTAEVSTRFYALVSRELDCPNRFSEELGLTPKNWLPAAWELLPFSFVADYFINIGACLSAGGVDRKTIISCGKTTQNDVVENLIGTGDPAYTSNLLHGPPFTGTSVSVPACNISVSTKAMEREVVDVSELVIIPTLRLPTFPTQWINLVALRSEMLDIAKSVFR